MESSSFTTFGRPPSAIRWALALLSGAVKSDDSRFKASENRSMRGIPQDRKSQFDAAVRAFRGEGEICVTNASLEVFLMETRDIEIPEEEKLRQLAMSTEHDIFAEGWTGLRAIYEAAAKANSQDLYVFCSWGISAHSWYVDYRTPELTKRLAIASEAEKVLTIALKLEPQDSHIAYILWLIYYDHPARDEDLKTYLSKAISWCRRALEWDEFRSHDAEEPDPLDRYELAPLIGHFLSHLHGPHNHREHFTQRDDLKKTVVGSNDSLEEMLVGLGLFIRPISSDQESLLSVIFTVQIELRQAACSRHRLGAGRSHLNEFGPHRVRPLKREGGRMRPAGGLAWRILRDLDQFPFVHVHTQAMEELMRLQLLELRRDVECRNRHAGHLRRSIPILSGYRQDSAMLVIGYMELHR